MIDFFPPLQKNSSFNSGSEMHQFGFCSQRSAQKSINQVFLTLKKKDSHNPARDCATDKFKFTSLNMQVSCAGLVTVTDLCKFIQDGYGYGYAVTINCF
jgi:hypothetical protein